METFDNSNINKISEKYQEELDAKRLTNGQVVQFRLLDGVLNPDPDERRKEGKEIIWKQVDFIRGKDTIRDPYNGKLVDIGVVVEIDEKGKAVCDQWTIMPKDSNGYITIVGGNVEQERFYEYMLICNQNESNPHRDKNIKPKFKLIDAAKESKEQNRMDDLLTDMLLLVRTLSKSERQEIASAYGWDRNSGDEVITKRLREIVKKDPAGFAKVVGNKNDLSIKATLNEALSEGIITFAPLENKYTFSKTNEVICTLTRSESVESIDQLLEWAKTHNSGKAVINNIKKLLKSSTTE
jgi:hypothetical protein